ncbi:MAG: hypothetical protein LHV68_08835 [Elusimicrobia bacterium]|nr:hypothetical protein [Candidatus Liberimonas magnetica]
MYVEGTANDLPPASLYASGIKDTNGVEYCIIMESNTPTHVYENGIPDSTHDWQWDDVSSTWTLYSGTLLWTKAEGGAIWNTKSMTGKWYTGRWYLVKSRAIDKADNQQDMASASWTRFAITQPADHLTVSVDNASPEAGQTVTVTIEARDNKNNLAKDYTGTVVLRVDQNYGIAGSGPEFPRGTATPPDGVGWLPSTYTFVMANEGKYTYVTSRATETLKFAKQGTRTLWAADITDPTHVNGKKENIIVSAAKAKKLRVLVPNQVRAPGVYSGITGSVVPIVAGTAIEVTVDACDDYWNVAPSTSAVVNLAINPRSSPSLPQAYEDNSSQNKELKNGSNLPQGTTVYSVTLITKGNRTLTASAGGLWTPSTSGNISVSAQPSEVLQVLVPGEVQREGKSPHYPSSGNGGKSVAVDISTQTVDNPFAVTVNACDKYWNTDTGAVQWIDLATTDIYDTNPSSKQFSSGSTTFTLNLKTGNLAIGCTSRYNVVYASASVHEGAALANASSTGITVKPSTAAYVMILMNGETHKPGKTTAPAGKLNSPATLTAGTTTTVTVLLTDKYYNFTSTANATAGELTMPIIDIYTSDPNDPFSASAKGSSIGTQLIKGKATYPVWLKTANDTGVTADNWLLYARDTDGEGKDYTPADTPSQNVQVDADTVVKLLLLVPGETHVPASAAYPGGKSYTTIGSTIAGREYIVTVKTCDRFWNRNRNGNTRTVYVRTPDDTNDDEPIGSTLNNGLRPFTLTMKTVGITGSKTQRIFAVDPSNPPSQQWSTGTISGAGTMTLYPDAASRLSLIVQGENEAPGTALGKSGPALQPDAGQTFWIRVNVCDQYFNRVLQLAPTVQVSFPNDYGYDSPPAQSWMNDGALGYKTFNISLSVASTQQVLIHHIDNIFTDTSTIVNVKSKQAAQLLLLMPGEQFRPGKTSGIKGKSAVTPDPQTAGVAFIVTALSVDEYWNQASTNTSVSLTLEDQYAGTISPKNLVLKTTFSLILYSKDSQSTLTLTDGSGGMADYWNDGSTMRSYVNLTANVPYRAFVVAPGECATNNDKPIAGKYNVLPYGKSGTPTTRIADTNFTCTLYVVDQYYNLLDDEDSTPVLSFNTAGHYIRSNDPNDGTTPWGALDPVQWTTETVNKDTGKTFTWRFITSIGTTIQPGTGWNIIVDTPTNPSNYKPSMTQAIKVTTNTVVNYPQLLVLQPNQAYWPGSQYGKSTRSGADQVAGSTYTITVKCTDRYFNQTNDAPIVSIKTYDAYDDETQWANKPLAAGQRTFVMKHYTAAANSAWLTAVHNSGGKVTYSSSTTNNFMVNPSSAVKLQVIVAPAVDETEVPGKWNQTPYGKTSSITTKTAGTSFNVRVNGVDLYWNKVTGAAADVKLASTDTHDSEPLSTRPLDEGTTSFIWTFISATTNGWTLTATDEDAQPLTSYTSPVIPVNGAAASKLLVLVPDEVPDAGSSTGRSGTVATQTAGVPFVITVNAVDSSNNINRDVQSDVNVWLKTTDPYDATIATQTFINGTTTFTHIFITATDATNKAYHPTPPGISASWRIDAYSTTLSSRASSLVLVNPNNDTATRRLLVLVPGETPVPGKNPYTGNTGGKNSNITSRTAGVAFNVTVNACDYWWNRNISFNPANVSLTSNDPNYTPISAQTLNTGTTVYSLTLVSRNDTGWTVSANHADYTGYTSPQVPVAPNAAQKLLVLLPNQTDAGNWGTSTGRSGTPGEQTAGKQFKITVKACDNWFNFKPTDVSSICVVTSDTYDLNPSTRMLVAGVTNFTATVVTAGSGQNIKVYDRTSPYMDMNTSDPFDVVAGSATKLLVLLPNQTPLPGSATGRTGTVINQTAGTPFTVTVRSTDNSYNLKSNPSMVRVDTSDQWDLHPSTRALEAGTTYFEMMLVTAGAGHVLTSRDAETTPTLALNNSSTLTVVPNSAEKLQLLVPGETAVPGKYYNGYNPAPHGKTSNVTTRTAGKTFVATVNLVDAYFNKVSVNYPSVRLTSTDPYYVITSSQQLQSGTTTFTVKLVTSGSDPSNPPASYNAWTMTASDVDLDNPLYVSTTSPNISVSPDTCKKYQIILPGETAAPGKTTGKSGKTEDSTVRKSTAGVTFPVYVRACDDYWNVCNVGNNATVTTTDSNGVVVPSAATPLVSGKRTFDVTLKRATTIGWTINVTGGGYTQYTTAGIVTDPSGPSKLLCLVPNETHAPGSSTGKGGSVLGQTAGKSFVITTFITDSEWNLVPSTSAKIGITTTDPYDVHPDSASTSGGVANFSIEFHKGIGESYTIKASTAEGNKLESYTTPMINSVAGDAVKLQLLTSPQAFNPGSSTGKTGTPSTWISGTPGQVTARVVDKYWNRQTSAETTVRLACDDPYYSVPVPNSFPTSLGQAIIDTTLISATQSGWTIIASTIAAGATNPQLLPSSCDNVKVTAGVASKMLVLVPGESLLPGSTYGRTGNKTLETAGVGFNVTVQVTDNKWNPISDSTQTIRLTSNDPFAPSIPDKQAQGGYAVFFATMITGNAGALNTSTRTTTLTTADVTAGSSKLVDSGTGSVPVGPAPEATYLLMLLPNQTHNPGHPPYAPTSTGWNPGGASGYPSVLTAGASYYITVGVCDKYWNINPNVTAPVVTVTKSDTYTSNPPAVALSGGKNTFEFSCKKATLYQELSDKTTCQATAGGYYISQATVSVSPAPDTPPNAKLLILPEGQSALPGSVTGKTGNTKIQTAGVWFPVKVFCTDRYNNINKNFQPGVTLTSTDPNDDTALGLPGFSWDPKYQPLVNGTTVFMITLVTANTGHYLTANDTDGSDPYYGNTMSDKVNVNSGGAVKLQVLLPGETAKPNTAIGKEGTVQEQTAGKSFNVTVNCTDVLWNRNDAAANTMVALNSAEPYAVLPSTQSTVSGQVILPVTLYKATTSNVIISSATTTSYILGTSSIFTVIASTDARLHITLPGETYKPGKGPYNGTGGKQGTITQQTAGQNFTATVRGTDNYYNLKTGMGSALVTITYSDQWVNPPNSAALSSGVQPFVINMVTYSTQTVYATYAVPIISSATSSGVYIHPKYSEKYLQILAPNEVAQPGHASTRGRSGSPSNRTAGVAFKVTVNACDQYYNPVSTNPVVTVTTNDVYDQEPASKALIGGTTTFDLMLVSAKVTRSSATANSFMRDYTGDMTVIADDRSTSDQRLQILLPNEKAAPGKWNNGTNSTPWGKTGYPSAQTAGVAFPITVRTTDKYWNPTTIYQPFVDVSASDPNNGLGVLPIQLTGGVKVFDSSSIKTWFVTANRYSVISSSYTSGTKYHLPYVSTPVYVNSGGSEKLLALVPGETYKPGTPNGKSGPHNSVTAGLPFNVTVYGCDSNWNYVNGETSLVRLTNTDIYSNMSLGLGYKEQGLDSNAKTVFSQIIYKASTHTFTATDQSPENGTIDFYFTTFTVTAVSSAAVKMQVLVPGETYKPGKPPYTIGGGKTGAPWPQVAGSSFTATARLVDPYWNTVNSGHQARIDTQDPYDVHPATTSLVGGKREFDIKMVTSSSWTLTGVDIDNPLIAVGVSSPVFVAPGGAKKLQVLLPGETLVQGHINGKTGTPKARIAGKAFNVTVNLCDDNWNTIVSGPMPSVTLGSDDVYWSTPTALTLSNGTKEFAATLITAATHTITAQAEGYTLGVSSPVYIRPNEAKQLLVVLPNQQRVNGKYNVAPFGRSGSVATQTSGVQFYSTVYAVDDYYNWVSTVTQNAINTTTSDTNDVNPGNLYMAYGLAIASCTVRTVALTTISAQDNDGGVYPNLASGQSSPFTMAAGPVKKLQVLVPGEFPAPGTDSGRTGTPYHATAGHPFTVTVRTCDTYWNLRYSTPTISVWTSDPNYNINNPGAATWSGLITTSKTVALTMVTASTGTTKYYVYVEDQTDVLTPLTSQGITTDADIAEKLLVILDGEDFKGGTATGKSGMPAEQTAGTAFPVRAAICDHYWNRVTNVPELIKVTSPVDLYDVEPSSSQVDTGSGTTPQMMFTLTMATTYQYIRADDVDYIYPQCTGNNSSVFNVKPAPPTKLQILLPGETGMPGKWNNGINTPPYGKTGSPGSVPQTAGVSFNATVNLVDVFYNVQTAVTQPYVHVNTNDKYDVEPSTKQLVSGSNYFDINLHTANTFHMLTAIDTSYTYTSDASPLFTLEHSSAARLIPLMPNETYVPGSSTGKTGTPSTWFAGGNFTTTVYLTDMFYNRVRDGVTMPNVTFTSWDPQDTEPSVPLTFVDGANTFPVFPKTAASTWTLTAVQTDVPSKYMSGKSSDIRIWPGNVNHFEFVNLVSTVIAGTGFDVRVNIHDPYHNLVDTGTNWTGYATPNRLVRFISDVYTSPQNASTPADYDFALGDNGTALFPIGITLRRASKTVSDKRHIQVYDTQVTSIKADGYIYVRPGSFYKMAVSTSIAEPGSPVHNTLLPAGSASNNANIQVIGQMVDSYNNEISSAGLTAHLFIRDVYGSTGTIKDGAPGQAHHVWESTTTDANGRVGYSSVINGPGALYYYASTIAGHYARVWIATFTAPGDISAFTADYRNISGRITTTGGTPVEFRFKDMPASMTAGIESPAIKVERYDVFGNITSQGLSQPILSSNSLSPQKQFRWPSGASNNLISVGNKIDITNGNTFAQFYYYDEMSSYPQGENSRPGQWQLKATGLNLDASQNLIVKPAATVKLAFTNPPRTELAKSIKAADLQTVQEFIIQPQDSYSNPTISTFTSIFVHLTSDRLQSKTSDYYAFSISSMSIGSFNDGIRTVVEIATNTYFTKVYYKDTRASNSYTPVNSKPIIQAKETPEKFWTMGTQLVTILPDYISKTVFISPNQQLTAGTTSQLFLIQTQDPYSNPSPVLYGDSDPNISYTGIRFGLSCTSPSTYKRFKTVGYGWQNSTGVVLMKINTDTTSFYMVDTCAGNYNLRASEDRFTTKGWGVAIQTYTVVADVPYKMVFATPPRRLIAGTTIGYYPDYSVGVQTNTAISIQVQDFWGNTKAVSQPTIVSVRTKSPPSNPKAYASVNPNPPNPLTGYTSINPTDTPLPITLNIGDSTANFYFKSEIAGTVPIEAWIGGLQHTVQNQTITPNKIRYFTIEHSYTNATPLSVQIPGPITVQARDQYGNRASGDTINGNYYVSKARFWSWGSTATVTLNPSTFTFTNTAGTSMPEPGRFVNLQITDLIQENLRVGASDYLDSSINGFTSDIRGSAGDIVTVGVVMNPADFAPGGKTASDLGLGSYLVQGDGTIPSKPSPIAMVRMTLQINPNVPTIVSSATWTYVRVQRAGSLGYNQVAEISLYKDAGANPNGRFDGDTVLGNPYSATDLFLSSGTITDAVSDEVTLKLRLPQVITRTPQVYFLCVKIPSDATRNATLGLKLPSNALTMTGTALLARNNFPFTSYLSSVHTEPAKVLVELRDISAWYDPDADSNGPLPLKSYDYVPQGFTATGMIRIGMWTRDYTALWKQLTVTRTGVGPDSDLVSARLFSDNGDGLFQFGTDMPVSEEAVFSGGQAKVLINNHLIDTNTQYFFLVYKIADGAVLGNTIGARLTVTDFSMADGNMAAEDPIKYPAQAALFNFLTATPAIQATQDHLIVDQALSGGVVPGAVTQGDQDVPLVLLRLRTDYRNVLWNNLKLTRRNVNDRNSDKDVANVKVYYDRGIGYMTQGLTASSTASALIRLTTTYAFGPKGYLYVGNEIMQYTSVISSDTCIYVPAGGRGALNTAAVAHGQGEPVVGTGDTILQPKIDQLVSPDVPQYMRFVSSNVSIPINGPNGGQQILADKPYPNGVGKVYFIAYDVDYFAALGETYLGLDVKTTGYFTVNYPKLVDPSKIPFSSEIVRINEYPDKITVTPKETTIGDSLMQGTTNQAVLSFTLEADKSYGFLNSIYLNRTGNTADVDVTAVKIWYDGDDNGFLSPNTTNDWVIGTGTFGGQNVEGEAFINIATNTLTLKGGSEVQPDLWRKIATEASKGKKNYFITYDISPVTLPEYTMGVKIKGASAFLVSTPNTILSTNLPYESQLRTIVASPRNVTVVPEALDVSFLAKELNATDNTVYLQSVANFQPVKGGAVIDTEIILYDSINLADNTLNNVTRGTWGSKAASHAAGAMVSRSYEQGMINASILKLKLSCDNFQVRWYRLKLNRTLPAGLYGYDQDVKNVKIWKDNGNGIFDRDQATGLIASETLVSTGTANFGTVIDGVCFVQLHGDGIDGKGEQYLLIKATPTVFWVTMDIDQTATQGAVIGVQCPYGASFEVGARERNDPVHHIIDGDELEFSSVVPYKADPFPFRSGSYFLYATVNTLSVNYEAIMPGKASQNATNVPMMSLSMKSDQNTVIWQGLKVDLTGTAIDKDLSAVKIWADVNKNGLFDAGDRALNSKNELAGLITYGTEHFANRTVAIRFKKPPVVNSTETVKFFVTYDLDTLATIGHTLGLSIANTNYFIVNSPSLVKLTRSAPYATDLVTIQQFPNTLTFEPYPWSDPTHLPDLLNGAIITQGDLNVPVMKFRLKTDVSEALWTKIRVERIGQGAAGQTSGGTNNDIALVKIFKDSNGNEKFDGGDLLISSGTDKFPLDTVGPTCDISLAEPQIIRPVSQVYFVVYDIATTAYAGNSIGVKIKDRSSLAVNDPNSFAVFPTSPPFQAGGWFQSSYAPILPIKVKMACQNLAPVVKLPGDKNIPMLKLNLNSESNPITISSITVYQTGEINRPQSDRDWYLGIGDGDFSAIKLWRDDGDGLFDQVKDTMIDSIPSKKSLMDAGVILRSDVGAIRCFSGGLATLYCGDIINAKVQNYFLTADMGTTDLGGKPVFQHSAGLTIGSYSDLSIVPRTSASSIDNTFPYESKSLRLADVAILAVNVRPDKPGVNDVAWFNSTTKISAKWEIIKVQQAQITSYMAALGSNPDLEDMTMGMGQNGWASTPTQSIDLTGLALSEPIVTFLGADLLATQANGTSITAYLPAGHPRIGTPATAGFDSGGQIIIGREIIGYTDSSGDSFKNITRGLHNTTIEDHYKSDQITNHAYFLKVKAVSSLAGITPQVWGVIKVDMSPPSNPENVLPAPAVSGVPATEGKYEVKWVSAKDFESGIEEYEVQERMDANPVWQTIDVISGNNFSINVGDGLAADINGVSIKDDARPEGHFYYYRVRAKNGAGSWGPWSEMSLPATTGIPNDVISAVSNYPNPFDTRRGGQEGKTNITYILNQNAEVTISVYDLLGYLVTEWRFSQGEEGGKQGTNVVPWDGTNEAGQKVAKGGYIAQIKVKSNRGVVTSIRKIGVIH